MLKTHVKQNGTRFLKEYTRIWSWHTVALLVQKLRRHHTSHYTNIDSSHYRYNDHAHYEKWPWVGRRREL